MFTVFPVSRTAQFELESDRVKAPACVPHGDLDDVVLVGLAGHLGAHLHSQAYTRILFGKKIDTSCGMSQMATVGQ